MISALGMWADFRNESLMLYNNDNVVLYASKYMKKLLNREGLCGEKLDQILELSPTEEPEERNDQNEKVVVKILGDASMPRMDGMVFTNNNIHLLDLSRRSNSGVLRMDVESSLAEFVAQIAHEVRNPLAGIATTIDILSDMYDNEEGKTYCALLNREIDRVATMLKNLMDLASPSGAELQAGRCNFKSVLWKCIEFYEVVAQAKDVTIELDLDQGDIITPISETRLSSILRNVIINAFESMKNSGRLSVLCKTSPSGRLQTYIMDTGKGIESEELQKMFKPFWSTRRGGTGLGLAVAKRFINEAGGTITAKSALGRGTTVLIELPTVGDRGKE